MKRVPESALAQLYADWQQRGWKLDDVFAFRMEGEGEGGKGGDGGEGGSGSGDSGTGAEGSGKKDPTFSQAEVDRIAAREKDQGKRAAEEAIAKQLGVTIDEAKKIIGDARAADDAKKDEATKAQEAAVAAKADADREKAEAARARTEASVERALIRALPKDLEDDALDKRVARLVRAIDVETGADADAIKAAVDDLKKDMPELFGAAQEGGGDGKGEKKPPPNGDPKGKPPKGGKQEDAFSRGAERAKTGAATGYAILGNQA